MKPGDDRNQPHHPLPAQSWFSSKKTESPRSFSATSTPSGSSSSTRRRSSDGPLAPPRQPPVHPEQEEILLRLKNMSVDKLRKLLADKSAYDSFFLNLDQVKNHMSLYGELQRDVLQLARENLAKDTTIKEMNSKCEAIRDMEYADAEKKLDELGKEMEEIMAKSSPSSLLQKLQNAMHEGEEESEYLRMQLLADEIDLSEFVQKYKDMRYIHHKRDLLHLAAEDSFS